MFFSKSTIGFYDTAIHGDNIPDDAVEITTEQHATLMQEQSEGQLIVAGDSGYPTTISPPKPVRTKDSMEAEVAGKRFNVETGGIHVAGHHIATDRESQAQLNNVYMSLKNGLIDDTYWKAGDNNFMLVTRADLEPVALAVAEHVRECFAAEQMHNVLISALATQAEFDAYDVNAGWPTQTA